MAMRFTVAGRIEHYMTTGASKRVTVVYVARLFKVSEDKAWHVLRRLANAGKIAQRGDIYVGGGK